ncbi:UNVERIFIED_CONTAM: Ribonuclease HI [Sesamum indicum]
MQLESPKSIKEVQQLTGRIASLNRFIARFADRNLPFFKILRKVNNFEWNEECERALQELKVYLTTPPLLSNPMVGEKLYVYLAVSDYAVSSVLVREEGGRQSPVYYVSKMLQGAEKKYIQIEKLALALVITARKLRPYFQSHPIVVLTNHPLKQVMAKPDTSGRMVKWAVELGEFDTEFQTRNAIKAQVFADFLVEFAGDQPQKEEKWLLHVDGSSTSKNGGAGIYLQGPAGVEIEIAVRLDFPATNNEAEYEALIQGLQTAIDGGIRQIDVYTDSQLVAMQVQGTYETRERSMTQYQARVKEMMKKFERCTISQIPRDENMRADALSRFGSLIEGVKERKITVMVKTRPTIEEAEIHLVEAEESWKTPFIRYLKYGELPKDSIAAKRLQFKANRFTMIGDDLYKRTPEGVLLKCLDAERAWYVLREIHEGSCGNHSGGRSLAQKILRQGYFWPTVVEDAKDFAKKCESCQRYAGLLHSPATPLEPLKVACPFDKWGIDIVGPFPPSGGTEEVPDRGGSNTFPNGSRLRLSPRSLRKRQWNPVPRKEDHGVVQRVENSAEFHSGWEPSSERSGRGHQPNPVATLKDQVGRSEGGWVEELPGGSLGISNDPSERRPTRPRFV